MLVHGDVSLELHTGSVKLMLQNMNQPKSCDNIKASS